VGLWPAFFIIYRSLKLGCKTLDLTDRINAIIEPTVVDMGYDLVRTHIKGSDRLQVQVMAERLDGTGMGVDDCASLSRAIAALLDVDDPITKAYTLEVSSPGIDRPLVKLVDFERFVGFDVRIEAERPVDGRRRFTGPISAVKDQIVAIKTDDGEVEIPFDYIARAKLLLTDRLIAAATEKGLS
jgi:ribosome maturation factor RimP